MVCYNRTILQRADSRSTFIVLDAFLHSPNISLSMCQLFILRLAFSSIFVIVFCRMNLYIVSKSLIFDLSLCVCDCLSLCLSLCVYVSGELILSSTIRRVCTYVVSHFSIVTLPSLCVCLSVSLFVCLSLCLCVCLSVFVSVSVLCLSLCFYVSGDLILSRTIRRVCTYVVS